jgi:hypothetical protein
MIESIFTPTHSNALKSLLNQPLAGTFHHSRTEGNLLLLKLLIVSIRADLGKAVQVKIS